MDQVIKWMIANQSWLIPLVLYLAINLAKRDYLVTHANPIVRGIARALEKLLVLEWSKWGGNFKFLIDEDADD